MKKLTVIDGVYVTGLVRSMIASGYPMRTGDLECNQLEDQLCYWYNKYNMKREIDERKTTETFMDFLVHHREILISGGATGEALKGVDDVITALKRCKKLGNAKPNSGHDCFLKGINVSFDMEISQAMSQQIKRYHFIDIISSTSTMHRITKMDIRQQCNEYVAAPTISMLKHLVQIYNEWDFYYDNDMCDVTTSDIFNLYGISVSTKSELFEAIVYNIPSGLRLRARWTTNYLQLKTIYAQRKSHKLSEWHEFCDWCKELPLFKELCIKED